MIRARCGAADSVGRPGGVRQQRLAKSRKGALELARQRRQIVDHQRELENIKNKRKTANQQLAMDGKITDQPVVQIIIKIIKKRDIYRASRGALELVGRDGSNGGASSAFVRDPVERILGRVLAIAPQTAPTKKWTAAKLETEAPTHSLYSTVNSG